MSTDDSSALTERHWKRDQLAIFNEHGLFCDIFVVYLPPAYVVRREGNVLTCVCLSVHRGGTRIP